MDVSEQSIKLVIILLVSSLFAVNVLGQTDEVAAIAAISKVEKDVSSIYMAVLDADNVGANVSGLLARLNTGTGLLATAEMCYSSGNFSGVVYFAELARESLHGLENEAAELANSVGAEKGQSLSLAVGVSVFGVSLVLFLGFLAWGYVRELYVRRVMKMRPEVQESDGH